MSRSFLAIVLLILMSGCARSGREELLRRHVLQHYRQDIREKYDMILLITPNNCPAVVNGLLEYTAQVKMRNRVAVLVVGIDSSRVHNQAGNEFMIEEEDDFLRSPAGLYMPALIPVGKPASETVRISVHNIDSVFSLLYPGK